MPALLGIPDSWVWVAYILSILSVLGCVGYGYLNWNRGDDAERIEDRWLAVSHKKIKEDV